ncbi:hypothetical protein QGP82_25330 [Leptothoe sp. LEGE 181152]|nr:hypothetical protein [Leptothoe sp. LEGE 181152]
MPVKPIRIAVAGYFTVEAMMTSGVDTHKRCDRDFYAHADDFGYLDSTHLPI